MTNLSTYIIRFFVEWKFADSILKYCIVFFFWSFIGFWLFRLIAEYTIYWFAISSGLRAPAEGVSFIRVLAGFFYIICALCFFFFIALTYPIRRARKFFRNDMEENSRLITGYDLMIVGFLILYPGLLYFFGIVPLRGPDLAVLIGPIFVIIATYFITIFEERYSYTLMRVILVSTIYLMMTLVFGMNVVNGEIFRLTDYGGNVRVDIKTRNKDGDCGSVQSGRLRLRTNDFLMIESAGVLYKEIPLKDVCELVRLQ
jgi:hypothetical protein